MLLEIVADALAFILHNLHQPAGVCSGNETEWMALACRGATVVVVDGDVVGSQKTDSRSVQSAVSVAQSIGASQVGGWGL